MSTERVEETCSCGARFVWSGDSIFARDRVKDWRADHRHAEAVGICADTSAPWLLPNGSAGQETHCGLLAGHLGAHSDGDGRHWWKDDDPEAMQTRINNMVRDQEFITATGTLPPRRQPATEETT